MPKILLLRTDYRAIPRIVSPPLGILYLASALRSWADHRFEVEVLDMRLWRRPFRVLKQWLQEFKPDMVGLSTLTFEANEMHKTADFIKQVSPTCPVIVGGPHGTVFLSRDFGRSSC